MPWFKADDGLSDNVKTRRAGTEAMGLWVIAGTWCARELTDGFVPKSIAVRWDPRGKYAKKLVEAGFWENGIQDGEQGYRFLNWTEYQPMKSEVEAERAAAAERMRELRRKRKGRSGSSEPPEDVQPNVQENDPGTFDGSSEPTSIEVPPKFDFPDPTRPDPSFTLGHLEGGSLEPNARPNDPPPRTCPEHPNDWMPDCDGCREARSERRAWHGQRVAVDIAPATRCPKHLDVGDPPNCGGCKDARQAREAWDAGHRRRLATAGSEQKRQEAADRQAAIARCPMCRDTGGYVGTVVCDHDPERFERAKRGAALARQALADRKAVQTDG